MGRVRPARQPRGCFTIWIDGRSVNRPQDTQLTSTHLSAWRGADGCVDVQAVMRTLQHSPLQRSLSRALFTEIYAKSLRECHGNSDDAELMLSKHEEHVANLRRNGSLAAVLDAVRAEVLEGKLADS